jgi:hypothetical protein
VDGGTNSRGQPGRGPQGGRQGEPRNEARETRGAAGQPGGCVAGGGFGESERAKHKARAEREKDGAGDGEDHGRLGTWK